MNEEYKKLTPIGKTLYWAGCVKITKGNRGFYSARLRRLHPFSWVVFTIVLFSYGFNPSTFRELAEESVWF